MKKQTKSQSNDNHSYKISRNSLDFSAIPDKIQYFSKDENNSLYNLIANRNYMSESDHKDEKCHIHKDNKNKQVR